MVLLLSGWWRWRWLWWLLMLDNNVLRSSPTQRAGVCELLFKSSPSFHTLHLLSTSIADSAGAHRTGSPLFNTFPVLVPPRQATLSAYPLPFCIRRRKRCHGWRWNWWRFNRTSTHVICARCGSNTAACCVLLFFRGSACHNGRKEIRLGLLVGRSGPKRWPRVINTRSRIGR